MVLKFSPTLLVGRVGHHLIRWSVVILDKLVRTKGSLTRSSSSSAAARTHASSRRAAGCGNLAEPSFIFPVRENNRFRRTRHS